MRFQCILCFTIIRVGDDQTGQIQCPNCSNRMTIPSSAFQVGGVIDDFVVEGEIGKGGMATVYRARQLSMDRPVALKILSDTYAAEEKFARSFLKEAKSAARINHPNLIQAVKVGAEDGNLFYAMELVKGITVGERITRDNALEMDYALNIVQQTAEALHVAWTQESLIHRDIKPDNIMLADDGHAKLMDLGIAVRHDEAENVEVSGTPKYMSPEQFRGKSLDCRSDIYSLGATLYHMLIGNPPFSGKTLKDIAREHLTRDVSFPQKDVLYVPQRVKKLISRMMSKIPDDRYNDYDELLEDVVFIRKRLAPDENMVPSVHTVSFSKYKVMEGLDESPSEVFRRREEKKQQVNIAKKQAEAAKERPEPMFQPKHLVIASTLFVVTLILASLFAVVLWRQRPLTPFETSANDFLASDLEVMDRAAAIQGAESIAAKLPQDASTRERETWLRLKSKIQQFEAAENAEWATSLAKQRNQLSEDREALDADRGRARADADMLVAEYVRIENELAQLEVAREEILTEQLEQRDLAQKVRSMENRLEILRENYAKQQNQVRRAARAAIQLEISTFCRSLKFNDARAVVENAPFLGADTSTWKSQKLREIQIAEDMLEIIYDSGALFSGHRLYIGRIVSITRDRLRVVRTDGDVENYDDATLAGLSAREIADVVISAELGSTDTTELAAFAMSWGDFGYAQSLSPDNDEMKSLIADCLAFSKHEITVFYQSGNRKYAAALASRMHMRFGLLPGYETVKNELLEMFGVARTTVPDLESSRPKIAPAPSPPPRTVPPED